MAIIYRRRLHRRQEGDPAGGGVVDGGDDLEILWQAASSRFESLRSRQWPK